MKNVFILIFLILACSGLFAQIIEDFETGDFTHLPWTMSGDEAWVITSSNQYQGLYSAQSGNIGDSQTSVMQVTQSGDAGNFTFWYNVSSEVDYDFLHFYIDNDLKSSWSGEIGWSQASYSVTAGGHTYKWIYEKDSSALSGQDCAWIDNIEFPSQMTYSGSSAETASTDDVYIGCQNNEIIRLNIEISGNSNPIDVTSITFDTAGSTSTSDIANAKVFYTTDTNFSTASQFGSTVSNPSGSFIVNATQELSSGNNYFWLAYDITAGATEGNVVDAQCTSVTVNSTAYTPNVTNPAGSRTISMLFSGGSGSSTEPFQIADLDDLEQLMNSSDYWDDYFIQTANIDAANTQSWSAGSGFTPIGNVSTYFSGNYDGQNFCISNLYINRSTADYMALFGAVRWADIANLELVSAQITGQNNTGGIVAYANGTEISSCKVSGTINGRTYVGGIAGYLFSARISNSINNSSISGRSQVAGMAGYIEQNSDILYSYNGGTVSATMGYAGGITASSDLGEISSCCNTGSVDANGNDVTGGVVAESYMSGIYDSYNGGSVSGGDWIGGLIGSNESSSVEKCYSSGSVNGVDYTGGLIGDNISSNVDDSFWDINTSGQASSDGGTGKTTSEMKNVATFTNIATVGLQNPWDFVDIWEINSSINNGYPYLQWQSFNPATPENVQIVITTNDVTITWDAVTGADSYKVYSSDQPDTGFTEDSTGTFTGESWSAPISSEKKFYNVKAVND